MNKSLLFGIGISITAMSAHAQSSRVDTVAVSILDHMTAVLGELNSCSLTVKSTYDVRNQTFGLIKRSDEEQVFLHAPDKMLVKSTGDKGLHDFYYDGKNLSYYSYDNNQFARVQAPNTIMEMIDSAHKTYGIDFPVADFFYPAFVDDIIADSKSIAYLGMADVNGKACFHIAGTTNDKTYQFWICNDAFYLPMKLVIVYTNREMNPQYEALLTDWKINPDIPNALFEFNAPPHARKIKMMALSLKK